MNTFLIGDRLVINHYPDWSGTAFISYEDAEYRVPGEVAKILVESLRAFEHHQKHEMRCAVCGGMVGEAWTPTTGNKRVKHAICELCNEQVVKERQAGALNPIPEVVSKAAKSNDSQ